LWGRRWICLLALSATIAGGTAATAAARPLVAGLQVALRAQGLYLGPIDSIYGPATARALRGFQRRAGLEVDGRIGPATRRALGPLGRHRFGSRVLRRGMRGWDVSVTQFLLTRHGATLPVDGHFSSGTERALRRFQRAHRLEADGLAGRRTFTVLLAGDSQTAPTRARETAADRVRALIDYWAAYYAVDRALMHAIAWMESGYQPNLTSPAGAWGVMQIRPSTWSYVEAILLGRTVPRTVSGNIRVGVAFMRQLLREFSSDRKAIAAWYQGPSSVRRSGLFRTTRLFVADVVALRGRVTSTGLY
jgi:peptidoglycan hydrolase-like protein with peptidoglycan-binding domain